MIIRRWFWEFKLGDALLCPLLLCRALLFFVLLCPALLCFDRLCSSLSCRALCHHRHCLTRWTDGSTNASCWQALTSSEVNDYQSWACIDWPNQEDPVQYPLETNLSSCCTQGFLNANFFQMNLLHAMTSLLKFDSIRTFFPQS